MTAMQTLVFGVSGQELALDAPDGRPASVTSVEVFEAGGGESGPTEGATTGSASIDSVNTTVDADSGFANTASATRIYIANTSGIEIGRDYLLTSSATAQREAVNVVQVVSDDYVTARSPLVHTYASGDSFASTRMTIAVDDAWASDTRNITDSLDPNPGYRVRWVYTLADGSTSVRYSYFDLARNVVSHGVTATDIDAIAPGFLRMLPTDHQADRAQRLIDSAYDQLTLDLLQEGIPDQALRNAEAVDELVARRTLVLLHEARVMGGGDTLPLEVARDVYQARFDSLLKAPGQAKIDIAIDTSGAGSRRSGTPLTVR